MSSAAGTSPPSPRRLGLIGVLAGLAVLGYAGYLIYRASPRDDQAPLTLEVVRYQRNLWAGHKLTASDLQATKASRRGAGAFPRDAVVGANVESLLGRTLGRDVEEGDFACWSHVQPAAPTTRPAPPAPDAPRAPAPR